MSAKHNRPHPKQIGGRGGNGDDSLNEYQGQLLTPQPLLIGINRGMRGNAMSALMPVRGNCPALPARRDCLNLRLLALQTLKLGRLLAAGRDR